MIKANVFRLLTYAFACVLLASLASCSDDRAIEAEKRVEFAQIVESRSNADLLNDLYIAADGDEQALSRMLQTTPSTIQRIRKGESEATPEFSARIREVMSYYLSVDKSYEEIRAKLDREYSWYDSVLDFPSRSPYWFWGLHIIVMLVFLFVFWPACFIFLVELILYLAVWFIASLATPKDVEDSYITAINPSQELLR